MLGNASRELPDGARQQVDFFHITSEQCTEPIEAVGYTGSAR